MAEALHTKISLRLASFVIKKDTREKQLLLRINIKSWYTAA